MIVLFVLLTMAAYSVNGQASQNGNEPGPESIQASGGQFTLQKSAVAGGGNRMQQSQMTANGTAGQSIAGGQSNGGQFKLYSGFWTPDDFAPTAAGAVVGGRVMTADGNGIRNVIVTIGFSGGETRRTLSSSFGYYSFVDIPAGSAYTISVSAKRFRFGQPVRILTVQGDMDDIDFIANAQE